jgi:hypothetical protein
MKSSIIKLACLLLLVTPLHAQQGADVAMLIDVVAWGNEIKGLSLKSGSSKGKITALGFRYSAPVAYSGPAVMEIYQTESQAAEPARELSAQDKAHELHPLIFEEKSNPENKSAPKQGVALELEKRRKKNPALVALAVLPGGGCRRATVLLAPAATGTYIAYVIDDDPSKLPLGQLRIHNLSPIPISVRCNGKPAKELNTRESLVTPATNQQLIYELAYKAGDEWQIQENNVIPVRAHEQSQMIILKSSNSYFMSSDGASGGFLQIVTLRRSPKS